MLMNGKEIKSLEDLKINFNTTDLVKNFQSDELSKWLLSIGYVDKSAQVDNLSENESMLLTKLCEILEINPNLTEEEIQYL